MKLSVVRISKGLSRRGGGKGWRELGMNMEKRRENERWRELKRRGEVVTSPVGKEGNRESKGRERKSTRIVRQREEERVKSRES